MSKSVKVGPKSRKLMDGAGGKGTIGRQLENAVTGLLGGSRVKVWTKELPGVDSVSEVSYCAVNGVLCQAFDENVQLGYGHGYLFILKG